MDTDDHGFQDWPQKSAIGTKGNIFCAFCAFSRQQNQYISTSTAVG